MFHDYMRDTQLYCQEASKQNMQHRSRRCSVHDILRSLRYLDLTYILLQIYGPLALIMLILGLWLYAGHRRSEATAADEIEKLETITDNIINPLYYKYHDKHVITKNELEKELADIIDRGSIENFMHLEIMGSMRMETLSLKKYIAMFKLMVAHQGQ